MDTECDTGGVVAAPTASPTPTRKLPSCKACNIAKRQCDRQRPCSRCKRVGKLCEEYPTIPRKKREPGTVNQRSCTACRMSKTKCSTNWPCKRCIKRGTQCGILDENPPLVEARVLSFAPIYPTPIYPMPYYGASPGVFQPYHQPSHYQEYKE